MTDRPTIDHIGIIVENLEDAVASYEKFLGIPPQPVEEMTTNGIRVVAFEAANITIELIEYLPDEESSARTTMGDRPGLNHISKQVDDMDTAVKQLTTDGFDMAPGFPVSGLSGEVAFFAPGPANAILLEICQQRKPKTR